MKPLFLRAMTASLPIAFAFGAAPAVAETSVIRALQVFADSDQGIGTTRITVRGNKTRYNRVGTKNVKFWLRVTGHAPDRSIGHRKSDVRIGTYSLEFNEPNQDGNVYKGEFAYQAPRNGSFDAVLFCNGKLNALSGDARIQFLREGGSYSLRNAYNGELKSRWALQENRVLGFEDVYERTWENEVEIIAQIKCAALDKQAGAVRTNPPPSPQRTNPTPPDPSTLPRLKTASLTITPFAIEQVNGDRCPTKLRLRGFLESNRNMKGKVIFVGPQYLSPTKDYDFQGSKTMNHIATYTIKWGDGGSDTLALNTDAPKRQDLNFKFNIVNRRGKLVKSVTKSIRVTCE